MRLRRLYAAVDLHPGSTVELPPESARHAVQVLRMRAGDQAVVFDGRGSQYLVRLTRASRRGVAAEVVTEQPALPESPLAVTLAQGLCRREKMDWVMQKATELGVMQIIPVIAERSIVRLDSERAYKRLAHWRAIVAHACEQCGRSRVPVVEPTVAIGDFLATHDPAEAAVVLDPEATATLPNVELAPHRLTLLVGPEGGLAADEAEAAVRHGFVAASIGPRTLRTETAALTAIAIAQTRWGDI